MPRAKAICSVATDTGRCLNTKPCVTHGRKAWSDSARNRRRPGNWKRIRGIVIRRDGFACVKCGSLGPLEVDHILPVAKGGSWEPTNLQTLCSPCHKEKTLAEFS
jgi:5-methylcytosine-specific restriction protein A